MEEKILKTHLERREAEILEYIQVDVELLSNLVKNGAIDGARRKKIEEEKHNSSRIHVLFEYVGLDVLKRLNPLLHALRETNQTNAADKITDGLNLNQQGDVVIETAAKQAASCSPASSMTYVTVDQKRVVQKIMDGLIKRRVYFLDKSDYSDDFADYIKQYGVIQDSKLQELKEEKPRMRMRELIDYLKKRPQENQLQFAQALIKTGQKFVLTEVLGLTEAEITYIQNKE